MECTVNQFIVPLCEENTVISPTALINYPTCQVTLVNMKTGGQIKRMIQHKLERVSIKI